MDTRIAIHALSRSVDIYVMRRLWDRDRGVYVSRIAIHWSRYVSRYLGRDTIRVSPAQVSRSIDASLRP